MSAQSNAAPVIIKRKKVVKGDGHHGGAWKVAYADFVTAMMAFFLLMWLLNATTEKQRKGLADYFSPTIPISRISGGGDGSFGGESVYSEDTLPNDGRGASQQNPTESNQARGDSGLSAQEAAEMAELQKALDAALKGTNGESMVSPDMARHIITRVTDEGLVVELFDTADGQLFAPGLAVPTPLLEALTGVIVEVGALVVNQVAVEGHIAAAPVILKENPVWDLSTERANAVRLLLKREGLGDAKLQRMTGHADRDPAVRNPMAVRNNRIEVIFLRSGRG